MDQNSENKFEIKDLITNFYNNHKFKIYIILFLLFSIIVLIFFFNNLNKKNNILISEKYIKAGLYFKLNEKNEAKKIYEEIILSKNKFYSVLALNALVEKELILEKSKVLEYFDTLEESVSSKSANDLVIFKKAMYLMKNSEMKKGVNLLNELVENNSSLKPIAQEILNK